MSNLTSYNYHVCSSFFLLFISHWGLTVSVLFSVAQWKKPIMPLFQQICLWDNHFGPYHMVYNIGATHQSVILGLELAHIKVSHFTISIGTEFQMVKCCGLMYVNLVPIVALQCVTPINNISKTYLAKMMWVVQAKSLANLSKKSLNLRPSETHSSRLKPLRYSYV